MGLFGKKKKKADNAQQAEQVSRPKRAKKKADASDMSREARVAKLKRPERLASVVNITVLDQVMNEVRSCDRFCVHHHGDTYYVGLMLDVLEIGGLSRKQRNDASRGQLLECISNGQISVIATEGLVNDERLVIIPTEDTMRMLDEFSFMKDATYVCVFVSDDGTVITPYWEDNVGQHEIPIEFEEACQMYPGITVDDFSDADDPYMTVVDFFYQHGISWSCDEVERRMAELPDASDDMTDMSDFDDFDDEDIELDGDDGTSYEPAPSPDKTVYMPTPAPAASAPVEPPVQPVASPEPHQTASPQAPAQPVEVHQAPQPKQPQPARNVAPADWYALADKVFHNRAFDFDVDCSAFDVQFAPFARSCIGFSNKPFATQGPIAETLDAMRKNANDDIRRLHRENLNRLRTEYIRRMNEMLTKVAVESDIQSDSTLKALYDNLKQRTDDEVAGIDANIDAYQKQLQEEFAAAARAYGSARAQMAEQEYREQHAQEYQRRVNSLRADLTSDIMAVHEAELDLIYQQRNESAESMVAATQAKIIADLAEEYKATMQQSEDALFREHDKRMRDWLEENRSNDLAYMATLQEKLHNDNEVARIREVHAQEINSLQARANADVEHANQQLAQRMAESDRILSELKENHKREIERLRNELDTRIARESDLVGQVAVAREDANRDSQAQIDLYKTQLDAMQRDRDNDARRFRMTLYPIIAVTIVIAICAGFIGLWFGINNGVNIMMSMAG